jgi:hypothetical protein
LSATENPGGYAAGVTSLIGTAQKRTLQRRPSALVARRVPYMAPGTSMLRQHKLNGNMVLAEGSSNLMQGLSRLPAAPHVISLLLRKL